MCYAIPAKLIEIKDNIGIVDYFGEKRNILLYDGDVEVGNYVYAQGGILVRSIPEDEALIILETWKELFFELKKTDEIISKLDKKEIPENVLGILQKVNLGKPLANKELISLFSLKKENELKVLFEVANNVRQKAHGNASCVHGIIEFSNYCRQNCHYCGIRSNKNTERYRMSETEIVNIAQKSIEEYGFKAIVLQSGEDLSYSTEDLCSIVQKIKNMGVLVFLSIGQRSKETYASCFKAGARAALLRFETSNETIFQKLRPSSSLKERLELIRYLSELGYVLATGFILGLPGERSEDILNNILLTRSLKPEMYSFGPLIPTKGTPLEQTTPLNVNEVLRTISICRLISPDSNILVTTALETLDKSAKQSALLAGANSMMIHITPPEYKKLYSIYDHRACLDDTIAENVTSTIRLLTKLGRAPTDIGF